MRYLEVILTLLLTTLVLSDKLCEQMKQCVLCNRYSNDCPKSGCIPIVSVKKIDRSMIGRYEKKCMVLDKDGCGVNFVINLQNFVFPFVYVERRRICEDSKEDPVGCVGGSTGIICSGHGRCVNRRCQCYRGYFGKFCENCRNCDDYCDDLKYCVQCKIFSTGPLCATNCSGCVAPKLTNFTESLVPSLERRCSFVDQDLCSVSFVYSDFGVQRSVFVDSNRKCSEMDKAEYKSSSTKGYPCMAENGLICSGRGRCLDGSRCSCYPGNYGEKCGKCKNCQLSCSDLTPCVLCRVTRSGPICSSDCSRLCPMPEIVHNIHSMKELKNMKRCRVKIEKDCVVNFAFDPLTKQLLVNREIVCPSSLIYTIDALQYMRNILKN